MVTRYEADFKKSIVKIFKAGHRLDKLSKAYGPLTASIRKYIKKHSPVENGTGESISADELNFKTSSNVASKTLVVRG